MGRIVVTEFISLDGVIEDPGGSEDYKYGGWSFEINRGDEGDKFKLDEALDAARCCWGAGPTRASRRRGRPVTASSRTSSTACPSTWSPRP